jgi:thiamine-phosphate pyrophosphorylase
MLRYYITDRHAIGGEDRLLETIGRAVQNGVDYIQLREKDLSARAMLDLTRRVLDIARAGRTKILVNERVDVALAAGADGVHLRSNAVLPPVWRRITGPSFLIGVSCHTAAEVQHAAGADLLVFGPVFDSPRKGPALGLEALQHAVAMSGVPVLALGGVSESNAPLCIQAGAAGIAAIRMFQEGLNRHAVLSA